MPPPVVDTLSNDTLKPDGADCFRPAESLAQYHDRQACRDDRADLEHDGSICPPILADPADIRKTGRWFALVGDELRTGCEAARLMCSKPISLPVVNFPEKDVSSDKKHGQSTPLNASQSTVKGIEFQLVDNRIAHLPGPLRDRVGFSVNATRLWAKMDFIVAGNVAKRNNILYQPNWLLNGSLFYRIFDAGEVRVAYNWMDRSLNTVNAQTYQDYVLKARGQMNASVRLPITKNLIVKLEADNILGANTSMMHGYFSERYTLGVNRKFFIDIVLVN